MRLLILTIISVILYIGVHSGISYASETNSLTETSADWSNKENLKFQRHTFHKELLGFWRRKSFVQGAWVDLIWYLGRTHAWHVVTVYSDEALQIPLLRWDIVRAYKLEDKSTLYPKAYNLIWKDRKSTLTPYVDNPILFSAIGVNDCNLQVGQSLDTSLDNCGDPIFPFRKCEMMDFVELKNDLMTFGEPQQGDRCEIRPTQLEWSFKRVPFSAELWQALVRNQ